MNESLASASHLLYVALPQYLPYKCNSHDFELCLNASIHYTCSGRELIMPLLRDQRNEAKVQTSALPTTDDLPPAPLRQEQQDQTRRSLAIREMAHPSKRTNGGRYQLEDGGSGPAPSSFNLFKINAPDTMQMHQTANAQHAISARFKESTKQKEESQRSATEVKGKVS